VVARSAANGGLEFHLSCRCARARIAGGEVTVHVDGITARAPVKAIVPVGRPVTEFRGGAGCAAHRALPAGRRPVMPSCRWHAAAVAGGAPMPDHPREGMTVFRIRHEKAERVAVKRASPTATGSSGMAC